MSDPRTSKITLWHWLNYIYERESNKYKLEGIKMIIQKTTKKLPGIYKWLYTVAGHTVHLKEVTSCTFVYIISAYIQWISRIWNWKHIIYIITTMKYAGINIAKCLHDLYVWEKLENWWLLSKNRINKTIFHVHE